MPHGLIALHSNRIEDLLKLAVDWQREHPLPPLAEEVFLVQSNGMAQWLKLKLAADREDGGLGIQAGQRFEMPSRFLWSAYRSVLGEESVPQASPYDKATLQWRLMRLLPELVADEAFATLRDYLASDDEAVATRKRYQLSQQLADTFDQYQVYRADWLEDWSRNRDRLSRSGGDGGHPLAEGDRWQAELWRRLVDDIRDNSDKEGEALSRGQIHQRFIDALHREGGDYSAQLPPRITVFGLSSLPWQTLEALAAIGRHTQVMLMVNNPCQYYWGDIQQHAPSRQRVKDQLAPEQSESEQPLLATWGQQGRDYLQLLAGFDEPERYREHFRQTDLFTSPAEGRSTPTLLQQMQHSIFNLDALPGFPETVSREALENDRSLRFHSCHSAQREVEVLHDQLLDAFERDPGLRPRDVIVMVPDIQRYAPHIKAVFGLYKKRLGGDSDPRYLPYTISDSSLKGANPTVNAIEQLLHCDQLRFSLGDILGLLESPALQRRFRLEHCDPSELQHWLEQAGVRWGLDAEHRAQHDLPEHLSANTWAFGLNRLLLGYSSEARWNDIEPCAPFSASSADAIGALWAFIRTLDAFSQQLQQTMTPSQWSRCLGEALNRFFDAEDEADAPLFESLHQALEQWVEACDRAGFNEAIPLSMVREELLPALDNSGLNQRFLAGCVNFASLMPMRAVPFRMVCLLGLNDGDYPRQQPRQDFDLMRRRQHYRPGDRSRRDDDRYLFLEAVLSARESLYLSWVGRNIRDNSLRAQSILLAQLRDDIAARFQLEGGDRRAILDALTLEHPLQASSPRYLDNSGEPALFTYAREWHRAPQTASVETGDSADAPLADPEEPQALSLSDLRQLLRQPCQIFLRQRLKVFFSDSDNSVLDHEPFRLDGLERHQLGQSLLESGANHLETVDSALEREKARWLASGHLPPGAFGEQMIEQRLDAVGDTLARYREQRAALGPVEAHESLTVHSDDGGTLEDWIGGLQSARHPGGDIGHYRLSLTPGTLLRNKNIKYHRLLNDWLQHLAACSLGYRAHSRLVSEDGGVDIEPIKPALARQYLEQLIKAYRAAHQAPLPVSLNSGCAYALASDQEGAGDEAWKKARAAYDDGDYAERLEATQHRCYPDFDAIREHRDEFLHWVDALYAPLIEHTRFSRDDALPGAQQGAAS
ncbi:MAG: exodeoxyribonuclease V subunit gamma [Pseudomonadota bacterium]